jgi:hypothetical protein
MKTIVADTFEQLGGVVSGTAQQAKKMPADLVDKAGEQLGLRTEKGAEDTAISGQKLNQGKLTQGEITKKIAKAEKVRSLLHYREIQEEIRRLQEKRKKAIWEQEQIKRQQEELKVIEEKKKPTVFQWARDRAKQAVERFRGVSG